MILQEAQLRYLIKNIIIEQNVLSKKNNILLEQAVLNEIKALSSLARFAKKKFQSYKVLKEFLKKHYYKYTFALAGLYFLDFLISNNLINLTQSAGISLVNIVFIILDYYENLKKEEKNTDRKIKDEAVKKLKLLDQMFRRKTNKGLEQNIKEIKKGKVLLEIDPVTGEFYEPKWEFYVIYK